MMVEIIVVILLASSAAWASTSPGVLKSPPQGFQAYNSDPNINSTYSNQVYDPNFIPGFSAGLQNVSIGWRTGEGYARIGYDIGPIAHLTTTLPHLAVGPQCCNFVEVPRTQQFRQLDWGDYYYVRGGFLPPGVNVENFTSDFTAPAYVGLRTDWNWTVRFSIDWSAPALLKGGNEWASIGLVATQYVPAAPGKLVYTEVNFWMDENSSAGIALSPDGIPRRVSPPSLVTYHPLQLSASGNQTITVNLSDYLKDTLRVLGLESQATQPPVISYVYLNVEGYNFDWNGTLWSFYVMALGNRTGGLGWSYAYYAVIVVAGIGVSLLYYRRIRGGNVGMPPPPTNQNPTQGEHSQRN